MLPEVRSMKRAWLRLFPERDSAASRTPIKAAMIIRGIAGVVRVYQLLSQSLAVVG